MRFGNDNRGDPDRSGLVDLADYAALPDCLLGPVTFQPFINSTCRWFDFDDKARVDLYDIHGLLTVFGR